jgi:HlyD family secretion protein
MAPQVDLSQLAVERPSAASTPLQRKRSWPTRWGLPLAIIAGFIAIVVWSARDHWLPAQPVTVAPVILTRAAVQQAGTPLFQAAGWIEPRPTAITCSAMVEGVVQELLVVEGQAVEVDEPLARLVDADARLQLSEAKSAYELRVAERDAAQAVLTAAQQNVAQPVHLEAAHAEAEAALATLNTEIKNLPFLIKSAESRLSLAQQDLEGKKAVAEAIAGRSLQKAQSEFDTATAALADLEQRGPNLVLQQEAWQRKCEALHTKLKLKTDEIRAQDEAKANLAAAAARLQQAQLGIETAQLRLDRMVIKSPIKGRVLALNAQPGGRLMGINAASERDASTVVTLYDPDKLQVRADVRLEDVSQVQLGQPVQISTAASREPFAGHVIAVTSQADIQKNTLQVKVAIDLPSDVIRPEMLAQVVFLAPPQLGEKPNGGQEPLRLLVAKELIDHSEEGAAVWVADAERGVARRQAVQLGRAGTDQLVEVTQGLTALDKLIVSGRAGLSEGTRIRIVGNDSSLGSKPGGVMPPQTADPSNSTGKTSQ